MNYLVPEHTIEKHKLSQSLNIGDSANRIIAMLNNPVTDLLITEVTNEEYEMLRPVLIHCGIDFRIVTNVPEVDSPQSFLFEGNVDLITPFDRLNIDADTDADKFIKKLKNNSILGEEDDESF